MSLSFGALLSCAWLVSSPAKTGATVVYATQSEVFFAAGSAEGLGLGSAMELIDGKGRVTSCTIASLSEHHASCGVPGDFVPGAGNVGRFDARVTTQATKPPVPKSHEAVSGEQTFRRRERLLARTFPKVKYEPKQTASHFATTTKSSAALEHQSHSAFALVTRAFHYENLSMGVAVRNIAAEGLNIRARATMRLATAEPARVRFRPDANPMFYLWESALDYKMPGTAFSLVAGRFRPKGVTGATLLDGVQANWQPTAQRYQLGVYFGLVPHLSTLTFQANQWNSGIYYSVHGDLFEFIRIHHRTRLSLATRVDGRLYSESEMENLFIFGERWHAALAGRLIFGAGDGACCTLGSLRLGLSGQLQESMTLHSQYRFSNTTTFADYSPGDTLATASHRGDLGLTWSFFKQFALLFQGGASHHANEQLSRFFVSPELAWREFWGTDSRLSLGFQQGLGWVRSSTIYTAVLTKVGPYLRSRTRLSFSMGQFGELDYQSIRVDSFLAGLLRDWLEVRAQVGLNVGLPGKNVAQFSGFVPVGVHVQLELVGRM